MSKVWEKSRTLRTVVNRVPWLATSEDALNKRLVPEDLFYAELSRCLNDLMESGAHDVGDYLEFGVFSGGSLACAYQVYQDLGLDRVRFFGFDSFEGLPQEAADEGVWRPGAFRCPIDVTKRLLDQRGADRDRVTLVEGWYSDTLTPELAAREAITSISVAMIDCDLYASTVPCLDFLEPLIGDRAVLVFDDWGSFGLAEKGLGQKRAFEEWLGRHPSVTAREVGRYNSNSRIFRVERDASKKRCQRLSWGVSGSGRQPECDQGDLHLCAPSADR